MVFLSIWILSWMYSCLADMIVSVHDIDRVVTHVLSLVDGKPYELEHR